MTNFSFFLALLSAFFGAAGTLILFLNSYALEPLSGGIFGGPQQQAWNEDVKKRNKSRRIKLKWGLAILMLSFVLQFISVLLSYSN